MSLGEAVVDVKADTTGFAGDLKSKLGSVAKIAAVGLAGGVAALGGLAVAAGKATFALGETADELFDLQSITGVSVEKLQEMRFIAAQTGSDMDFYGTTVNQVIKRMTELESGLGISSDAMNRLGVDVRDAAGNMKSAEQITDEMITALQGIEDPTLRAQLATDVLGRKANQLIPVLDTSAAEMDKMSQAAHDMGGVLSEDALLAADEFRASVEGLRTQITGASNSVLAGLAPALTAVVGFISENVIPTVVAGAERFGELWDIFTSGTGIVDGLKGVFSELTGGGGIGSIFETIQGVVQDVFANLVDWLASGGIGMILDTLLAARARLLDAAITLFPAILEGLVTFVPQLLTFITGQLIPQLVRLITTAVPQLLTAAVTLFTSLVSAVQTIVPPLLETLLGTVLPQLLGAILAMVPDLVETAITLFNTLIEAVLTILPQLIDLLFGTVLPNLVATVLGMIPVLLETAVSLFTTLLDAVVTILPQLLTLLLTDVLPNLLSTILGMIPSLLETAISLFFQLVLAVLDVLPDLVTTLLTEVLPEVLSTLLGMIPDLIATAITVFVELATGIVEALPQIIDVIVTEVIPAIALAVFGLGAELFEAGKNAMDDLLEGIKDAAGAVIDWVEDNVVQPIADLWPFSPAKAGPFAGTGSPLHAGRNIMDQLAQGLMEGTRDVHDAALAATRSIAGNMTGPIPHLAVAGGGGVRISDFNVTIEFHGDVSRAQAVDAGEAAAEAVLRRLAEKAVAH